MLAVHDGIVPFSSLASYHVGVTASGPDPVGVISGRALGPNGSSQWCGASVHFFLLFDNI